MINQYLLYLKIGIVVVLIATFGFLVLQLKTVRAERDLSKVEARELKGANESLKSSLDAERLQREVVEKLLADRMVEQKKIETEVAERLRRKNLELAALRKANAETNTYLNLPVPTAYVDWMRQHANSPYRNDTDVPPIGISPAIN
jgi:hypothetical protein